MGRSFNTGTNFKGNTSPEVRSLPYTTGQTFKKYALVVETTAGEVSEAGADPAAIVGVALQGAGTGLGYGGANSTETTVVTGRAQEVSVAIANRETIFHGRGVNGGTDPVVPLQTHVGEQYGVAKVGDDWVIDFAETTTKIVQIVDIIPAEGAAPGFFLFKFLEARLQRP
jgi:hypothetical protein